MTTTPIFLVQGFVGAYSDAIEWTIAAYRQRDLAETHAQRAKETAAAIRDRSRARERRRDEEMDRWLEAAHKVTGLPRHDLRVGYYYKPGGVRVDIVLPADIEAGRPPYETTEEPNPYDPEHPGHASHDEPAYSVLEVELREELPT